MNLGAVAQLAERLHGMQEVRGSIPLSSTSNHSIWSVEVAGFLSYFRPDRSGSSGDERVTVAEIVA